MCTWRSVTVALELCMNELTDMKCWWHSVTVALELCMNELTDMAQCDSCFRALYE